MATVLVNFVQLLAFFLWFMLIARVVLSWTNPMGVGRGGGLVAFVYQMTEPILAPIRRIIPPMGGIDLGPLIILIILSALWRSF